MHIFCFNWQKLKKMLIFTCLCRKNIIFSQVLSYVIEKKIALLKIALKPILSAVIVTLILVGCSRKKDRFINRNFHAITAEYNTLFNGFSALEQGRNSLNASYRDNYWAILPIERMQIEEEVLLPGQSKNAEFTKAEEKAVKAIQKHSMNVEGKEKNPQMDEAYLLLGKARYFDQRFIPALEAFNYILYKYPASDKINQAKVWSEKTNMRLDNNTLAITNLKLLLEQEELEGQDLADATSILAQAYINTKHLDSALIPMAVAAKSTKKDHEKGRYFFIKGQLYDALNKPDSANRAFDKVIDLNRKIPRKYLINAHLEKAKNFNYQSGDKLVFTEHLKALEEDRENRPFLDHIYHQKAQYYLTSGNDSLAQVYYNKSLRENSTDKILVATNYETLGDISFDTNLYKEAGAYYDSTMTNMVENSKPFRIIKRKRENLETVIYYEDIAVVNDSILNLVLLSKAERLQYFEDYTTTLKLQAEAEIEKQAIIDQKKGLAVNNAGNTNASSFAKSAKSSGKSSNFYFYNDQTVAYGKNEFLRIWGDRELAENWRWSSKSASSNVVALENGSGIDAAESELFDPEYYIAQIPSEPEVIATLQKDRNYAYYQLGLIYKEKFKEYNLSKNKFLALLKSNPEERLILPSKYNLYKIYELQGRSDAVSIAKNDIVTNYPDSRYAQILNNPNLAALRDENSPESVYEKVYALFQNQEFERVILESDSHISTFEGDAIVPKFELLKAFAIGRLNGFEAYENAINAVAVTYANTSEGLQAQDIINSSLETLRSSAFVENDSFKHFKVIYEFENTPENGLEDFVKTIDESVKKVKYFKLSTSVDVYNKDTTFVVVHGLKSIEGSQGFMQLLNKEDRKKIKRPFFSISSKNYRTLQIHKNVDAYKAIQ